MIGGINAVALGTHEMPRAIRFYCALGFEVRRGNEQIVIHHFSSGDELSQPRRPSLLSGAGPGGARDLLRRRC